MSFKFAATLLSLVLLAGCQDSYHPVKREAPVSPHLSPHAGDAGNAVETESANGSAEHLGDRVDAGAIELTAPEQWGRKAPRSGFVLAEFALPKDEGDEQDGRLTVSVAGGSIEANIERWRGQFGGKPEKDSQEEIDVDGLKVTVVDLSGTFNEQAGPFAPGVTREGYRMLAAIIPVDEQLHFIKAYGPEKTMAEHADAFRAFLRTVRSK